MNKDNQQAEREWLPIDSAPRNVMVILFHEHTGQIGTGHLDNRGAWWWRYHPTHWLPMPNLPTPPDSGERNT